jgi:hypothetical protein
VLFYGLPLKTKDPPAGAVPLHEFVHHESKRRAYSTDRSWSRPGYQRSEQPLCLVWLNPLRVSLPRK